MKFLSSTAIIASLALAAPALAATAPSSAPAAATAAPAVDSTAAAPAADNSAPAPAVAPNAAAAGVNASAAVGMPVKDNTGATIGQITAVAPDSTGKTMATVKMGAQSFAVDAGLLAVQGQAATINETKAQIQQQLPKAQ